MAESTGDLQAWAEIHLDRLAHNLRLLAELADGRPVWPVVKSNAYGHGAVGVARAIVSGGYDTLCVARVPEALELVEAGVSARILLLSPCLPEEAEAIAAHDFEPTVCRPDTLDALAAAGERHGRPVGVHVKVDTGMGRTGLRPDETPAFVERCRARPGLRLRGLMSHFPRADEGDPAYSLAQLDRFRDVARRCADAGIESVHLANSAGLFEVPGSTFDAVRPGISVYGLRPSTRVRSARAAELQPVLEWKARISYLKRVPAGTGISYGHSFVATRPTVVATLPLGYGDGVSRLLSNRMEVLVGGLRCAQIGNVTMDQLMVDVTDVADAQLGDEAVLIGRQGGEEVTAEALAATLGTIHYEIVTAVSPRLPRVFRGG